MFAVLKDVMLRRRVPFRAGPAVFSRMRLFALLVGSGIRFPEPRAPTRSPVEARVAELAKGDRRDKVEEPLAQGSSRCSAR